MLILSSPSVDLLMVVAVCWCWKCKVGIDPDEILSHAHNAQVCACSTALVIRWKFGRFTTKNGGLYWGDIDCLGSGPFPQYHHYICVQIYKVSLLRCSTISSYPTWLKGDSVWSVTTEMKILMFEACTTNKWSGMACVMRRSPQK